MRRSEIRRYRVSLFDGRCSAVVTIVDGYDRPIGDSCFVIGVRTDREAIAAATESKFLPGGDR